MTVSTPSCCRPISFLAAIILVFAVPAAASAQRHQLVHAKDGSGVFGYKDTPVQPWSGFHVHDPDRPVPPRVMSPVPTDDSAVGTAPSDAVVLFDGRNLDKWQPSKWLVEDGELVATDGPLVTKDEFGDCQLHLEWMAPAEPTENIMNRGNNGVFLMNKFEVQIFDSFNVKLYPDGQAAAIYGQTPPLVNACREPGQWQSYDIVFTAPKYEGDKLVKPARLTMLHNGILVHLNQEIYGTTPHSRLGSYPDKPLTAGPLSFGAHKCPVRFRNIWVRRLAAE
jgi:hypothetical protein